MEYIKQQLKNLLSIPSPSGFTRKAADYIMDELKTLGYEPYMTTKGCVGVCLGGDSAWRACGYAGRHGCGNKGQRRAEDNQHRRP
jgi:putative aminopeptidase FrvX